MTAFYDDGDEGRGRHRGGAIAAWIQQTPNSLSYSKGNMCQRASPAPAYITCAHSLHTSEAKMRMRIPSKMLNLGMGLD